MAWPSDFYASFGNDQPEMVSGQLVSGNYFQTLETYPVLGRLLSMDDDRAVGGSPVAVISFGCWQRRFGQDRNLIGRKIVVNGMPLEIVGVAPPGFFGTRAGTAPEFWLPTTMQSAVHYAQHYSQTQASEFDKPWIPQPDIRWLQFVMRVKSPQALAQADAVLNQVYRQDLERSIMSVTDPQERQALLRSRLELEPGGRGLPSLRRSFSRSLTVLMGTVLLVLIIVCANLANLLLARAAAREREIAVRFSLGATRARLARQLLTECVLLSVLGAVLGIAVAYWCGAILPRWASSGDTPDSAESRAGRSRSIFQHGRRFADWNSVRIGSGDAGRRSRATPRSQGQCARVFGHRPRRPQLVVEADSRGLTSRAYPSSFWWGQACFFVLSGTSPNWIRVLTGTIS